MSMTKLSIYLLIMGCAMAITTNALARHHNEDEKVKVEQPEIIVAEKSSVKENIRASEKSIITDDNKRSNKEIKTQDKIEIDLNKTNDIFR